MQKLTILSLSILVFAASALADIPRPDSTPNRAKKPAAVDTHLSIVLDRDAKEARLIIPRSQIKALRAEFDNIDGDPDETTAALSSTGISRLQLIVSGVFLSLAVAFAGIWFSRNRKMSATAGSSSVAGMVIFAVGAFATIVYGNAGPPPAAREITGKMFSQAIHVYKFGSGKIKLEVSDTETQPKLIVPDPAPAAE
jgi:hypothetical protein